MSGGIVSMDFKAFYHHHNRRAIIWNPVKTINSVMTSSGLIALSAWRSVVHSSHHWRPVSVNYSASVSNFLASCPTGHPCFFFQKFKFGMASLNTLSTRDCESPMKDLLLQFYLNENNESPGESWFWTFVVCWCKI